MEQALLNSPIDNDTACVKTTISVTDIMPIAQWRAVRALITGEEGAYFKDCVKRLVVDANKMPRTYEQDGKGDAAVAGMHYFCNGCDWWITEVDSDPDGEGQIQASGLVNLGYGCELGYISLVELCSARGMNLDFHWKLKTIGEIKASLA